MGLSMREKKALTNEVAVRYRNSKGEEKRKVLDEFVLTTQYNRKYAITLLNNWGKSKLITIHGKPVKLKTSKKRRPGGGRKPIYDNETIEALQRVWLFFGCRCGKLLAPFLRNQMRWLVTFEEFGITDEIAFKLTKISPATIDRRLKAEREKQSLKGKSATRKGPLLKSQIPVRVFWPWDERHPGFFEMDTVHHCSNRAYGEYCQTLTITDVGSGWVELRALLNKAHKWVLLALEDISHDLPFQIKGLDSDSGSEFINHSLVNWTAEKEIQFTRGRSCHKNDNCFVEQKNDACVRQYVGYERLETVEQMQALAEVYEALCPLLNYFIPTAKMIRKVREGAKIKKMYEPEAMTPYQRLLTSPHLSAEIKAELESRYSKYNPIVLQMQVNAALRRLAALRPKKGTENRS